MIIEQKRLISSGCISFMSPIYQGISSKNTGLGNGLLHLTSVLNGRLKKLRPFCKGEQNDANAVKKAFIFLMQFF